MTNQPPPPFPGQPGDSPHREGAPGSPPSLPGQTGHSPWGSPPPLPHANPLPNPDPLPAPPPLDAPPPDLAALHTSETTRTYPCRACGGQLVFDPRRGKLRCRHCGNEEDTQGPVGIVARHDLGEAMRLLRAAELPASLDREVVCQSCGGHTAFTGTLTATRCPYCNTPIQRDDLVHAVHRLPIDGVLPFRVDEKDARVRIEKWIKSRRFVPKEFKAYRTLGSFESVYLAYFVYDAHASASYQGQRGENYTVQVGSGDDRRTETRTNWYPVSGHVRQDFRDVPAWANSGLDEGRVTQLEPWPLPEAVPYSPQYIAGHLGRTYDVDAEGTFQGRVRPGLENAVESTIRRDIGGDQQRIHHRDIRFDAISFSHLLLPVWLLTVTYSGKPYQVLMNGVTGEVQGARPWSTIKIVLFILAIAVVLAIIVFLVS